MSKRGYSCAVKYNCATKNDGRISFFRFPKGNLKRCQEWLKLCSREELTDKNVDYFYNNLRVCAKHFLNSMFLNDLQNRLQPHAKPVLQVADILNAVIIEPQPSCSFTKPINEVSVHTTSSSTVNELELVEGYVNMDTTRLNPLTTQVAMQTPLLLSASRSRKRKLRSKCKLQQLHLRSFKKQEREECRAEISEYEFKELCDKFLPENTSKFVKAQINLHKQKPQGRRYDANFKQFALQLYFTSPKAYRLLKKNFMLPSVRSLQRITHSLEFNTSFNDFVFEALKLKLKNCNNKQRICSILIDEMSLKASLFYNLTRDSIIGFHDEGSGKKFLLAQSVMVVMAKGLYARWKQPLAFFFTNTTCKGGNLKNIVFKTVEKLQNLSFADPRVVISVQGSNFVELTNSLNITEKKPYFFVGDKKIFYMFDPPHLIKSVRNNLLSHDIQYNNVVAKWNYIQTFYDSDKEKHLRIAPKLTNSHISPTTFERMRVKYATQVMSESVAVGISTYVALQALPSDAEGTARFLERFDKLFDLFNSSRTAGVKKYNLSFMGSDYQIQFLQEMLHLMKSIIIKSKTNKDITKQVKCFRGWCISINALQQLWWDLKEDGFRFLFTRRLNQDCWQNFFGAARSHGGHSTNPTPQHFVNIFKKMFSLNYIQHNEKGNCEEDYDTLLKEVISFSAAVNQAPPIILPDNHVKDNLVTVNCTDFRELDLLSENALSYVAGYLFRKCLHFHTNCTTFLIESKKTKEVTLRNIFCDFRAYETKNNATFGNLLMPGEDFLNFVREMGNIFENNFEHLATLPNVGRNLVNLFGRIPFHSACPQFPKEYVMKLFCRMKIYHTLKRSNLEFKSVPRKQRKIINLLHF